LRSGSGCGVFPGIIIREGLAVRAMRSCVIARRASGFIMPSTFQASTPLPASAEVMFEFHSDPSNLSVVMPPTMVLVRLETEGKAREGRLIELHCRDWWLIPMRWTCRWKTVKPPELLVDEMVKGPFALFVHEHRFEARGADACIMHDTISYQWGRSWWGHLVSEIGVRIYLLLLFKYRHFRTRKWADAASSGSVGKGH
jgi:ligand-binding SRPBCC domain-containing protein